MEARNTIVMNIYGVITPCQKLILRTWAEFVCLYIFKNISLCEWKKGNNATLPDDGDICHCERPQGARQSILLSLRVNQSNLFQWFTSGLCPRNDTNTVLPYEGGYRRVLIYTGGGV